MGVHSGKFGVVNGIHTVRNWQLTDGQTAKRFYASNTRSGAGRRRGIREWSGSFNAYGASPVYMPGDFFNFQGYTAPIDDTLGSNGQTYAGIAIVDSIALTWDWRNGELLSHVANFSGHMELEETIEAAISDDTFADPPPVAATKIQWGIDATFNDMANIATAVLTITAENQSYVNSSTAAVGHVWTARKKGNIDWTLALTLDETARSGTGIPIIDDSKEWKLFVDATTFWLLKWGRMENWTGINVDIESGVIIGGTVNIGMDGHNGVAVGSITLPGAASAWWPES